MGTDFVRGLLAATRASLAILLTLPLLLLGGMASSHPEVIVVLGVGLTVHALLCLLISRRLRSEGGYLLLAGGFFVLGVLTAAVLSMRLGYDLGNFALIFSVLMVAVALDGFRLQKAVRLPTGFWAGLSFQEGLFLYFLLT